MAKDQLYYFNMNGRGEAIRLAYHFGGLELDDIRFTHEEWPTKYKSQSPTGQAPWLVTDDGEKIAESAAISMYVGMKTGMVPTDCPKKLAEMMEIMLCPENLAQRMLTIWSASEESRPKLVEEFNKTTLLDHVKTFEKLVSEINGRYSNGKYLLGDKLSLGDFALYVYAITLTDRKPYGFTADPAIMPTIMRIANNIINSDTYKAYLEKTKNL